MMDEFEGKRSMVQSLLGALKKSAGDELAHGIGGDSTKKQVTHTPVPTASVAEHTHNKESYKPGAPERQDPKPSTADLNTGETPEMSDKPMMEAPKAEMAEPPMPEEDPQEDDGDSSAFSSLLKKRKK